MVAPLLTVAFFASSGAVLFRAWRHGKVPYASPALLFALSCLLYETFYGQFAVFLAIGLSVGVHRRLGPRAIWLSAVAFLVVQLASVWWNRVSPQFTQSLVSKAIDPQWYAGVAKNVALIPVSLYEGTAEVWWAVGLLAALLALLSGRGWRRAPARLRASTLSVVVSCSAGACAAAGLLAMARYGVNGGGHDSRTSLGVTFWLITMLVPLLELAARGASGRVQRLRWKLAALSLSVLAVANLTRMLEWGRAARLGNRTIASVPLADLRRASDGAVVLYTGPWQVGGIVPVGQPWVMSPAVWSAHPELRHLHFYAARDFSTRWDGKEMTQRSTFVPRVVRLRARLGRWNAAEVAAYFARLPPEVRVKASELWIWDARHRRATRASGSFRAEPAARG
jgi:hypothetical protein